jgi:spermidine/putrescine-binding protein
MTDHNADVKRLTEEARQGLYTRRQIIAGALALGLSASAVNGILANATFAQEATPAGPPAANGPVMVSIVNQEMSHDDIAAAIEDEGEVNVGNWTYTANDQLVERFQGYVEETYGKSITLNYAASQSPSTYITELYTAVGSGDNSPYDVMAIEENYWAEVQLQQKNQSTKFMEDYLPSGLIPNAERVIDTFKHEPTSIAFQASATPGVNYHTETAGFLKDWKDLADPQLQGKLLLWLPGDITSGGMLLGLAGSLGKDYKDEAQMREVIDYAADEIGPNAIKYTADNSEGQQLFKSGVAAAVSFWNSMARQQYLDGVADAAFLVAASGQYMVNGYLWIPVEPPHPVLAQVFIDWRLSDDAQFPDIEEWGITEGAWSELQEGILGPSYEADIPEWIAADYYNFFPTIEQLSTQYKQVDWDYYAEHSSDWFDYYLEKIGL